jgi:hypothetical protein
MYWLGLGTGLVVGWVSVVVHAMWVWRAEWKAGMDKL